ncbi:MAG: hypothetical protein B7Z55_16450, partial [Planctomycetales bacterium 12-60-4]
DKDEVLGSALMSRPSDCLKVATSGDKTLTCGQMKYAVTGRGGKGFRAAHRSTFLHIIKPEIALVDWTALESTT